jgi:autotransporter-associated beta strand protein
MDTSGQLEISANVNLASAVTLNGGGTGTLIFTGALGGPGGLRINRPASSVTGIVNNFGNSLFTGPITIDSGDFAISGPISSSAIIANGGTLRLGTSLAPLQTSLQLNQNLPIRILGSATLSGSIAGPGGLDLREANPDVLSNLSFAGLPSFTGAVTMRSSSSNALSVSGGFISTAGIDLGPRVTWNQAGLTSDTAPITMRGARLSRSAGTSELLGGLSFSGSNTINVDANPGPVSSGNTINFNRITRVDRGTIYISGSGLGQLPSATSANLFISNPPVTDMVGGGGATGTPDVSILPYATGFGGFVTYDPVRGLRTLDAAEYVPSLRRLRGMNKSSNVKSAAGIGIDSPSAVNSLLTSNVYGAGTLTIRSGRFAVSTLAVPGLKFDDREGIGSGQILSSISGTAGLTFAGELLGDNHFTSGLLVNDATLRFGRDASLGAPGEPVELVGFGVLSFDPNRLFVEPGGRTVTVSRAIHVSEESRAGIAVADGHEMTQAGAVAGSPLNFGKSGRGRLDLTAANTYAGETEVYDGLLGIADDSNLGSAGAKLILGPGAPGGVPTGVIANSPHLVLNRPIHRVGFASIWGSGGTITLNGPVTRSTSSSIAIGGGGTLEILQSFDAAPAITNGDGFMTAPFARRPMVIRVAGANGALAGSVNINMNRGATMIIDDRDGYLPGRAAGTALDLDEGDLVVRGNGAVDTVQALQNVGLTRASNITLLPDVSHNVSLNIGSLLGGGLIRGTNLGRPAGANVANLFVSAGAPVEGAMFQGSVGDDTADGPGRSFVTYSPSTGVRLLDAAEYGSLPISGGNGSEVVDITTPTSRSASININALRLRAAGSLNLGSGTLTLGTFSASSTGFILCDTGAASTTIAGGTISFPLGGDIHNNSELTVSSAVLLGTPYNLRKSGAGTMTINVSQIHSGGLTIAGGTVRVTGSSSGGFVGYDLRRPADGVGTSTLDIGSLSLGGGLSGSGVVKFNNGTFHFNGGTGFDGTFVGAGFLDFSAVSVSSRLGAANPLFSSTVRISGTHRLTLDSSGALGAGGTIAFNGGQILLNDGVILDRPLQLATGAATLTVSRGVGTFAGNVNVPQSLALGGAFELSEAHYDGVISGPGSLSIGSGVYVFSQDNSFSGGARVSDAHVVLNSDSPLGLGTVSLENGTFSAAGGERTVHNPLVLFSSPGTLTLGGLRALSFDGTVQILNSGTVAVVTPAPVTFSGTFNVNASATLIKSGGGNLTISEHGFPGAANVSQGQLTLDHPAQALTALTIADGAVASLVPGSTSVLRTQSLNIAVGGVLDVADNAVAVDYSATSALAQVSSQIKTAYNGLVAGDWRGDGITSSAAATSPGFGVGYGEAAEIYPSFPASFFGVTVDSTTVLLRYTRLGDANLDALVNLADFNRIAANFGQPGKFWFDGDFNYDGLVNLQDFNLLASNFGLSAGPDGVVGPQDWANLAAAVPEPAFVCGLCLLVFPLARTRSRRTRR